MKEKFGFMGTVDSTRYVPSKKDADKLALRLDIKVGSVINYMNGEEKWENIPEMSVKIIIEQTDEQAWKHGEDIMVDDCVNIIINDDNTISIGSVTRQGAPVFSVEDLIIRFT